MKPTYPEEKAGVKKVTPKFIGQIFAGHPWLKFSHGWIMGLSGFNFWTIDDSKAHSPVVTWFADVCWCVLSHEKPPFIEEFPWEFPI
jgi:hypothetical protein